MKNMLLTSLFLIFSNAVTSNKDQSILLQKDLSKGFDKFMVCTKHDISSVYKPKYTIYFRIAILVMSFNILLLIDSFHITPLIEGITIYSGWFNITIATYTLNIFIYLFSIVIMIIVVFYKGNLEGISSLLFLNAIVTVTFKLLAFFLVKEFDLWFLANVLISTSAVLLVSVQLGLKGEIRSNMFYFNIFVWTYMLNMLIMWVKCMVTMIDPYNMYLLLYILGFNVTITYPLFICSLNQVPWDNTAITISRDVIGDVNPGGPPTPGIIGKTSACLDKPGFMRLRDPQGNIMDVKCIKSIVNRYNWPGTKDIYPWRLTHLDRVPQNAISYRWFWGTNEHNIVFPFNPRLDHDNNVYNLLKDNDFARKEYFILKERAMIHYSYLNVAETKVNLQLLLDQKVICGKFRPGSL